MCIMYLFFNDTATTEIYTLSLHDALPIWRRFRPKPPTLSEQNWITRGSDRKSTRLNSSHLGISYAVFCLKKKKNCDVRLICCRLYLFSQCCGVSCMCV